MTTAIELISTRALPGLLLAQWTVQGLHIRCCPMIATRGLALAPQPPDDERLWVFTSQQAVASVLAAWSSAALAGHMIAALGQQTARSLAAWGIYPVVQADTATDLAAAILRWGAPRGVRFFCNPQRSDALPLGLREAGVEVVEQYVYETLLTPQAVQWGAAQACLFCSPSAVRAFCLANTWPDGAVAFALGPTTAQALAEAGIGPVVVADRPDIADFLGHIFSHLQTLRSLSSDSI